MMARLLAMNHQHAYGPGLKLTQPNTFRTCLQRSSLGGFIIDNQPY